MMTHRCCQDVHVGIGFKIDPDLIPSTDIIKLEASYRGGGLSDVWKCSMPTPFGIRTVSLQTVTKLTTYHNLGCCQVPQGHQCRR
jgi:hypothetical protein